MSNTENKRESKLSKKQYNLAADLLATAAKAEGTIIARSLVGLQIGAYRIEREIGRGGMGEVYLATRAADVILKNAAIKLIRCGIDTDFNIQRFRAEREILAALDHPNIARLIDGGNTLDGMPYLIMEYIEGKPLFKFCALEKPGLRHRLELFMQICAAVAHAHEVGVIHRDIKPGNILVTPEGLPKLLDFGVAKILNSELPGADSKTPARSMPQMTPEYASPEQINGDEGSYSSDVYSLGVLLYELITGERPYRFQSRASLEIARVMCENDPRKPSEFLTGDRNFHLEFGDEVELKLQLAALDKIVLKALQKNPLERYSSVANFKSDIENFISQGAVADDYASLPKVLPAQKETTNC